MAQKFKTTALKKVWAILFETFHAFLLLSIEHMDMRLRKTEAAAISDYRCRLFGHYTAMPESSPKIAKCKFSEDF